MGDATVGALAVPARELPAVPMATPVDPILTAIERDRIAYVAFAASLNKTDGRKAAREKGEVTQTDEDTHEAASGMGEDAVSEPADSAFGVRGRRAVLPSFRSPLATIRSAPSGNVAPERRTCTSRVLGHQVMAAGIA
jgi:hypothetical protein